MVRWLILLLVMLAPTAVGAEEVTGPLEPAAAIEQFQLDSGLRIELVVAEPDVVDPIAIRFDEDGRMWVVEMRDYPHGPKPGEPPASRIRVLEDADGDGRFENARTFAEGLLFPTGLQPWRGGVIVTLAGEVIYLKDTDGDGRADLRETWFQGFVAENPQLRANHPRLGLDNRVYVANGLRGGVIVDPRRPKQPPVPISGRDFCFDPHSGACEAVSGNGQFGLTFDDFGQRFVCNNRQPLDHIVLENRYLERNPFFAAPAVLETVVAAGDQSQVFPLTAAWTTSNLHAGQFTAACGIEIYRGGLLGHDYQLSAFTCEPTGSLVHRELLTPAGVTFTARPAQAGREFLASRDSWFRPVNLETGPDGAVYVVDMYRAVIEHPQYMPSELQNRPDLRLGDDRGRIWRIVPKNVQPRRERPRLSKATSAELVQLLEHANAWWRETAARLLFERQEKVNLPAYSPMESEPAVRVARLWVLAGLKQLTAADVVVAIDDPHPQVRRQAAILAERYADRDPTVRDKLLELALDHEGPVRFQAALSIGGLKTPEAVAALAKIALAARDPWTRSAVGAALPEHTAGVLVEIVQTGQVDDPAALAELAEQLATIVGARRNPADFARMLPTLVAKDDVIRQRALLGLAAGVVRRGGSFPEFVEGLPDSQSLRAGLQRIFEAAAQRAGETELDESKRALAIALLGHAAREVATGRLLSIIEHDQSTGLRIAAARALTPHVDGQAAETLLVGYNKQPRDVQRAILDALLAATAACTLLLEQVRDGKLSRSDLDVSRENRLRQHPDERVRTLAVKLLTTSVPAERTAVLAEYQPALRLSADPRRGKELFAKHCAICHRIDGVGVDVAPDISDSRVKTPEQLFVDILNPNQAIDNNYVSYTVVTADGTVHTGIIGSETANSLTLRQSENRTVTLLKSEIESQKSSGASLMPEGFEKHLSPQDLADLIGYVKNWRYLKQPIPGTIGPAR